MQAAQRNVAYPVQSVESELSASHEVISTAVQGEAIAQSIDEMFGRVGAIRQLGDNWDSYGAERPSHAATVKLLNVVRQVIGKRLSVVGSAAVPYIVAPLPDGGIQAEWRCGGGTVEVDAQSDGSFGYLVVGHKSDGKQIAREKDGLDERTVLDLVLSVVA